MLLIPKHISCYVIMITTLNKNNNFFFISHRKNNPRVAVQSWRVYDYSNSLKFKKLPMPRNLLRDHYRFWFVRELSINWFCVFLFFLQSISLCQNPIKLYQILDKVVFKIKLKIIRLSNSSGFVNNPRVYEIRKENL